ncbi:hypothetical protein C1645_733270 [Glomus cerebriforme]|uniref:Uncharacterized protein n=1 Tax=Glomus cerebriforme TaxID=658196 RepID=A0A397TNC1_9GLOM|nr:hypothetical protein C1645_733270 [Glomus cerebriforme]
MGTLGTAAFSPTFTSDLNKCLKVISQRVKENNLPKTWINRLYGDTKLLVLDTWDRFQRMFDESGFDVYMHRELDLDMPVSRLTEVENAIVNRRQSVSELMERMCDTYWRVKEKGNAEQTGVFIKELKDSLEPILNYHKGV